METELPKPSSEVDLSRSFSRFHSALANRSCYQMDKDLYTTYADRQHWNVLQRRISGIQLRSDEVCAPQVFGRSGYRINISLSAESYAALKEGIVKIVRAHMQERQSIYEFDVSNAHALAAQIQALREAYDFLQSRRGRILECDLSTNDEKRYRDIVTPYLGEQVTVPSDDDLNLCSERLSAEIIAGACLLKGDQIQIQIPDGYQVPNIVDLCMAVDSFLRANGASIGEMTPAESRIGNSCLGFWQEFLEEDLHKARQEVCIAASKRINSREPHPTDLTIARHAMAQKEREHCSLFLALSDALRQPL